MRLQSYSWECHLYFTMQQQPLLSCQGDNGHSWALEKNLVTWNTERKPPAFSNQLNVWEFPQRSKYAFWNLYCACLGFKILENFCKIDQQPERPTGNSTLYLTFYHNDQYGGSKRYATNTTSSSSHHKTKLASSQCTVLNTTNFVQELMNQSQQPPWQSWPQAPQ